MGVEGRARNPEALEALGFHVEDTIRNLHGIEHLLRTVAADASVIEPEAVGSVAVALGSVLGDLREHYAAWAGPLPAGAGRMAKPFRCSPDAR